MSALRGKADIGACPPECPFVTQSGPARPRIIAK
jgi:hypothetical protein